MSQLPETHGNLKGQTGQGIGAESHGGKTEEGNQARTATLKHIICKVFKTPGNVCLHSQDGGA